MIYLIEFARVAYVGSHIVVHVLEVRVPSEVCNVLQQARPQVVHAHHAVAFGEKTLTEVASQETRPAGHERLSLRSPGPNHARSPCNEYRPP